MQMIGAKNRDDVLKQLTGGLWHTTHPERYKKILDCGAILLEPDIPDKERWKTGAGPIHYPYVRTLGGVSLFDFNDFEPVSYAERYPLSTWYEFIPFIEKWQCAVWIEIDRLRVAKRFISAAEIVARWKAEKAYAHTFMPLIEAAFIGELPRSAFVRAFIIRAEDGVLRPLGI